MKLFFKRLLLFFSLFTLLYLCVIIFIGKSQFPAYVKSNLPNWKGMNNFMFEDLRNNSNVNLLFVGSSHSYRGFDTRIFENHGFKTFNIGTSSQTPEHTEILLNHYLYKFNPDIIVFEVFPLTFTKEIDLKESSINIIANEKYDPYLFKLLFLDADIRHYNLITYKIVEKLFQINKSDTLSRHIYFDNYIKNGYVERDIQYFKNIKHPKRKLNLDENQFESFSRILKNVKEKNIKVILVFAPITKSLYESYENKDEFDAKMNLFGNYFNFNHNSTLNDSLDFFDEHHLNRNGVYKFNQQFVDVVKKHKN